VHEENAMDKIAQRAKPQWMLLSTFIGIFNKL